MGRVSITFLFVMLSLGIWTGCAEQEQKKMDTTMKGAQAEKQMVEEMRESAVNLGDIFAAGKNEFAGSLENEKGEAWQGGDDSCSDRQDNASLLELEKMLENNLLEEFTLRQSEKVIVFYETYIQKPFAGYQILVYRETSEKDILLGCILWVEKETGDIYMLGEEDCKLVKTRALKGLNLPDEPEAVLMYEYDKNDENDEVISECLDKVFDFLKMEEGLVNFKIKYDGRCTFLGRKYCCVSLIEDRNDDMIHTLQCFYIDIETGDLYQESDHIITGERMELYYMGNLED